MLKGPRRSPQGVAVAIQRETMQAATRVPPAHRQPSTSASWDRRSRRRAALVSHDRHAGRESCPPTTKSSGSRRRRGAAARGRWAFSGRGHLRGPGGGSVQRAAEAARRPHHWPVGQPATAAAGRSERRRRPRIDVHPGHGHDHGQGDQGRRRRRPPPSSMAATPMHGDRGRSESPVPSSQEGPARSTRTEPRARGPGSFEGPPTRLCRARSPASARTRPAATKFAEAAEFIFKARLAPAQGGNTTRLSHGAQQIRAAADATRWRPASGRAGRHGRPRKRRSIWVIKASGPGIGPPAQEGPRVPR